jgi:hypothetical protein
MPRLKSPKKSLKNSKQLNLKGGAREPTNNSNNEWICQMCRKKKKSLTKRLNKNVPFRRPTIVLEEEEPIYEEINKIMSAPTSKPNIASTYEVPTPLGHAYEYNVSSSSHYNSSPRSLTHGISPSDSIRSQPLPPIPTSSPDVHAKSPLAFRRSLNIPRVSPSLRIKKPTPKKKSRKSTSRKSTSRKSTKSTDV